MPTLADTTIRLLGQEPLAGRMPTAEQLRLAEILDTAGFAYLEVSGGGCFDAAVQRGVESPWERIRALKARVKTPLGLALRGRFLVGSRPVDADFARRFVASAAENGIDVFRLHDPLNDVSNLREAAEAIVAAERDFEAGLVYSPGRTGEIDTLIERARMLPELGAVRVLLHDPTGSLQPHRAAELVPALAEASGLPVGIYVQGAGGSALAATLAAAQAGAQLIACAVYPLALTLHRVGGEALAEALTGLGLDAGVDVAALWRASDLVDEHIGDEPVAPLAPRIAVRAAQHDVPAGLVAGVDATLRAQGAGDRLEEVLEELDLVRAEVGWPPLAAPIGQVLASQALLNVLSASRYLTIVDELRALVIGRFGTPPGPIDPAVTRAVQLTHDPETEEDVAPPLSEVREQAEGMAASEEELLLLGLFGEDAERLLIGIRGRASGEQDELASVEKQRAERIRELVRIVQESGIGEVTIEEDGMRVSVRSAPDAPLAELSEAPLARPEPDAAPALRPANGYVSVESPMVGTFYRAAQPGSPPFVEVGDVVGAGQTLCILEAMKLMNEVKSELEAIVRRIHVENAQPVEFGQVLFDLEPLTGRPLDAV
ncbi:MAG TPA: acetyl-CoA carboxylase biotin carboxyl carrier protein [Gaiellaceae bacterium]|nr:acetyl-CoA carboxylase biotin carboxyl carrier protein [Gaiellaceae bacterium]